jgi:hypothetical protein
MQVPTIQHIAAHMGGEVHAGHQALVPGPSHSTVDPSPSIKINDVGDDRDNLHRNAQADIALMYPVKAAASPKPIVIG